MIAILLTLLEFIIEIDPPVGTDVDELIPDDSRAPDALWKKKSQ